MTGSSADVFIIVLSGTKYNVFESKYILIEENTCSNIEHNAITSVLDPIWINFNPEMGT